MIFDDYFDPQIDSTSAEVPLGPELPDYIPSNDGYFSNQDDPYFNLPDTFEPSFTFEDEQTPYGPELPDYVPSDDGFYSTGDDAYVDAYSDDMGYNSLDPSTFFNENITSDIEPNQEILPEESLASPFTDSSFGPAGGTPQATALQPLSVESNDPRQNMPQRMESTLPSVPQVVKPREYPEEVGYMGKNHTINALNNRKSLIDDKTNIGLLEADAVADKSRNLNDVYSNRQKELDSLLGERNSMIKEELGKFKAQRDKYMSMSVKDAWESMSNGKKFMMILNLGLNRGDANSIKMAQSMITEEYALQKQAIALEYNKMKAAGDSIGVVDQAYKMQLNSLDIKYAATLEKTKNYISEKQLTANSAKVKNAGDLLKNDIDQKIGILKDNFEQRYKDRVDSMNDMMKKEIIKQQFGGGRRKGSNIGDDGLTPAQRLAKEARDKTYQAQEEEKKYRRQRDREERTIPNVGVVRNKALFKSTLDKHQNIRKSINQIDELQRVMESKGFSKVNELISNENSLLTNKRLLAGALKTELVGSGAVTEYEHAILNEVTSNPTKLLSFKSREISKLKALKSILLKGQELDYRTSMENYKPNIAMANEKIQRDPNTGDMRVIRIDGNRKTVVHIWRNPAFKGER